MRIRYAAALLGAALIAAAPVATAAPQIEPAAAKSCDLGFMPTKPTVAITYILGNAWARCDVPPEHHQMTLSLERRDGGAWVEVEAGADVTIPSPKLAYEVRTGCGPGLWRVTAHVTGSLQGYPFDFTDSSMERFVSADDCKRGG